MSMRPLLVCERASGLKKCGEIAGEHVGGDEPHPDGEDFLQDGRGEPGVVMGYVTQLQKLKQPTP